MGESFLYSVNAVVPIFLLVLLGALFKKLGWLSDSFFREANRFVFRVSLPVTLFTDILGVGSMEGADPGMTVYCLCAILLLIALLCVLVPLLVKSNDKRGAVIQGIYRSNVAILGVPLIKNMFGAEGTVAISMVMPLSIILFNTSAVVILSVFAPEDKKKKPAEVLKKIGKDIVTNPLIIGIVCAFLFLLFRLPLPALASKTLSYLSGLTMPLALMNLGAQFRFEQLKGRAALAAVSTFCRCVLVPLAAVSGAILLGFRGPSLGGVFVLFASPTAVSSYVMAENMRSDHVLAGQIILFTTLFSLFSLFAGVFVLKYFAFI